MFVELRGLFLLMLSLVFFLVGVGVLALGSMTRPGRWSDRPKAAH